MIGFGKKSGDAPSRSEPVASFLKKEILRVDASGNPCTVKVDNLVIEIPLLEIKVLVFTVLLCSRFERHPGGVFL